MTTCTFQSSRSKAAIARILAALATSPMTVEQLAAASFLTKSTMHLYIPHMRAAGYGIRIDSYEPRDGVPAAVYALGMARDAKRPKPRTVSQRFKALKADPEKYQRSLRRRRVSRLHAKVSAKPNTWFGALPGANFQEGAAC